MAGLAGRLALRTHRGLQLAGRLHFRHRHHGRPGRLGGLGPLRNFVLAFALLLLDALLILDFFLHVLVSLQDLIML